VTLYYCVGIRPPLCVSFWFLLYCWVNQSAGAQHEITVHHSPTHGRANKTTQIKHIPGAGAAIIGQQADKYKQQQRNSKQHGMAWSKFREQRDMQHTTQQNIEDSGLKQFPTPKQPAKHLRPSNTEGTKKRHKGVAEFKHNNIRSLCCDGDLTHTPPNPYPPRNHNQVFTPATKASTHIIAHNTSTIHQHTCIYRMESQIEINTSCFNPNMFMIHFCKHRDRTIRNSPPNSQTRTTTPTTTTKDTIKSFTSFLSTQQQPRSKPVETKT